MKNRILLIGKRKIVLKKLAQALEAEGFEAVWVDDVNDLSAHFTGDGYDLVAFGRGILRFDKEYLKSTFIKQNSGVLFVDGLAPVTELLVAQVRHAFAIRAGMTNGFTLLPFEQTRQGLRMNFVVTQPASISVSLVRLNFLYRVKQETISLGDIPKGQHSILLASTVFGSRKPDFVVVKDRHVVLDVQKVITANGQYTTFNV